MFLLLCSEVKILFVELLKRNFVKIAGVVVLYKPSDFIKNSIASYIDKLDILYVVDNSEISNTGLVNEIKCLKKIEYISNNRNIGIASALNIGAEKALENYCDFLLTMDQDSRFLPEMFDKMIEYIKNIDTRKIGLITPFHKTSKNIPKKTIASEDVLTAMTSGSIINLEAFKNVGGFLDELFIDHVDHEYCLRLMQNGYKIIQLNNSVLLHELGEKKVFNLIFKKLLVLSHSPLRGYYIVRNGLYVSNLYKKQFPFFYRLFRKIFIKEIIKTIFFEDQKIKRIGFLYEGYYDYKKGKLGKYPEL